MTDSVPTPSPRPAALVIGAMAHAVAERLLMQESGSQRWPPAGVPWDVDLVNEALRAAAALDHVLIPRAELEEAADFWQHYAAIPEGDQDHMREQVEEQINRLRRRSRG